LKLTHRLFISRAADIDSEPLDQ